MVGVTALDGIRVWIKSSVEIINLAIHNAANGRTVDPWLAAGACKHSDNEQRTGQNDVFGHGFIPVL
jgi:hypothetical protein